MNRAHSILLASVCIAAAAVTPALADPQPPAPAPPSHKHLAGVKYEDFAKSDAAAATNEPVIQVQSISWGKLEGTGPVYSADPMEGGQIAAHYRPGRQKAGTLTLTKPHDLASAPTMSAAPDSSDQPPPATGTTAKVKATFKTLAGACTNGVHLNKVKLMAREGSYTLRDVIVTDVTPAGDGMETVTVSYASMDQ